MWNQSNEDTLLFNAVFAFEPGTGVCTYLITQASLSDSSLGVHSGSALAESSTRSPFNEIYQPVINDTTHRKQMEISKVQYIFYREWNPAIVNSLDNQRLGQRSMKAACSNLRDSLGRCLEEQQLLSIEHSVPSIKEDGMELGSSSPYLT